MGKQISSRSQERAMPALEERVHRLEVRTEALAGAVWVLARGLESGPMAEPAAGRAAEAARRAHELLLAAKSAPPVDLSASRLAQAANRLMTGGLNGPDPAETVADQRSGLMNSRVKDVMTKDVVSVRETAEYKDIIAVMRELHVSAFPVLDSADHLVGVVSEADLLLKEVGQEALAGYLIASGRRGERAKAAGVTAAELMNKPAVTIGPEDSVAAAARRMHDRRVKRLPVVDDAGRLVGIVSRVDVLSVFDRPDDEIRDEVVKKIIVAEFALDPNAFNVTVRSGIVTITGQVESRAIAPHLIDALRHAEGVVDVRDRISFPRAGQQ